MLGIVAAVLLYIRPRDNIAFFSIGGFTPNFPTPSYMAEVEMFITISLATRAPANIAQFRG